MPVVLVVGIIAILVGVFAVATGRGGELAYEHADHAPLDLGPVSATDVALLRPPTALWGYNMQVTDEALDRIARALRDRDIEIAYLQRQLADLGHAQASRPGPDQDEEAASPGTAAEEPTQGPRRFVPKHERPRAEAITPPAATEDSPAEPDNDDAVAAAEEQGW